MRPIFLVGYMGSGKSTIGRKLAEALGWKFVDTDVFLEARFRQRVSDMFASVGEEAFRRRERIVIEEISGMEDCVIATGGGLPCHHDNMSLMKEAGLVIYLELSDETLAQRLELCKRTRPTIKDKAGEELLEHVRLAMQQRRPIYEQAHLVEHVGYIKTPGDEGALSQALADRLRTLNLS